jgi:tellurite resistance protein TerC
MSDLIAVGMLAGAVLVFLWVDVKLFARKREPTFREGLAWSLGWLAVSLVAGLVLVPLRGEDDAVLYTTVYLIERSLSLDNLFVFLLLFSYFGVPSEERPRLLIWGIVAALVLRGLAILGGVALIEQFHFVIYILGATLLVLAYRIFRGVDDEVDPGNNLLVRGVRRLFPVTDRYHGSRWLVRLGGKRYATPLALCLAAMVFADLAFAVDSIPAAFGITRDAFLIWMANVFALLGLRALFVLVEGLIKRFRYLDETIAIVLAVVAVKLMLEDVYKLPAEASLALVLILMGGGILASVLAERREERHPGAAAPGTTPARLTPDEDPHVRHD